jgi:TPR repeat protein
MSLLDLYDTSLTLQSFLEKHKLLFDERDDKIIIEYAKDYFFDKYKNKDCLMKEMENDKIFKQQILSEKIKQVNYILEITNRKISYFLFDNLYQKGNIISQLFLGLIYYEGLLFDKDEKKSMNFFLNVYNNGIGNVKNFGGILYSNLLYLRGKKDRAYEIYSSIWNTDKIESINLILKLGKFYKTPDNLFYDKSYYEHILTNNDLNPIKDDYLSDKKIELCNDTHLLLNIVQIITDGILYEKTNYKLTRLYYQLCENNSNTRYCYHLALEYERGIYIEKNIKKAYEYFIKANIYHNTETYYILGKAYKSGIIDNDEEIIKPELDTAIKYFELGKFNGFNNCIIELSIIYFDKQINLKFVYQTFLKFMNQDSRIPPRLALMYYKGIYIKQNYEKALHCYDLLDENVYISFLPNIIDSSKQIGNYDEAIHIIKKYKNKYEKYHANDTSNNFINILGNIYYLSSNSIKDSTNTDKLISHFRHAVYYKNEFAIKENNLLVENLEKGINYFIKSKQSIYDIDKVSEILKYCEDNNDVRRNILLGNMYYIIDEKEKAYEYYQPILDSKNEENILCLMNCGIVYSEDFTELLTFNFGINKDISIILKLLNNPIMTLKSLLNNKKDECQNKLLDRVLTNIGQSNIDLNKLTETDNYLLMKTGCNHNNPIKSFIIGKYYSKKFNINYEFNFNIANTFYLAGFGRNIDNILMSATYYEIAQIYLQNDKVSKFFYDNTKNRNILCENTYYLSIIYFYIYEKYKNNSSKKNIKKQYDYYFNNNFYENIYLKNSRYGKKMSITDTIPRQFFNMAYINLQNCINHDDNKTYVCKGNYLLGHMWYKSNVTKYVHELENYINTRFFETIPISILSRCGNYGKASLYIGNIYYYSSNRRTIQGRTGISYYDHKNSERTIDDINICIKYYEKAAAHKEYSAIRKLAIIYTMHGYKKRSNSDKLVSIRSPNLVYKYTKLLIDSKDKQNIKDGLRIRNAKLRNPYSNYFDTSIS